MRKAMSGWLINLESYLKDKKIEKCPICGNSEADVQELDIGRESITFSCKECEFFYILIRVVKILNTNDRDSKYCSQNELATFWLQYFHKIKILQRIDNIKPNKHVIFPPITQLSTILKSVKVDVQ